MTPSEPSSDPGRTVGDAEIASSRSPYCGIERIRSFRLGPCSDAGDHVGERISVAANSRRGRHRGDDNAAMVVGPAVLVAFFLIAHAIVFTQLRANFSEDNRKADFDGRLQSGALRPSAPTGERSSGTGRREQRRRIRSRQLRISLLAG